VLRRSLRPYWLHGYLLAYIALGLLADSRVTALWQQYGLGLLTVLVLWLCSRLIPEGERRQVWLCVGVATCFEIFGSLVWGVYRYRFHNLPLYVPPGHGLVYLFGLTAARTPVLTRYPRQAAAVALAVATAWTVAGLTVLTGLTGRVDVLGALCLPLFALFLLRSPRYQLFTALFIATSWLEIIGTSVGTWAWLPIAPGTHVGSGNPPSVIAGGYCVIDGSVIVLSILLSRLTRRLRPLRTPVAKAA
jgi:hypothetical protein